MYVRGRYGAGTLPGLIGTCHGPTCISNMTWVCLSEARAQVEISCISQGQASAKAKAQGLVS